MDTKNQSSAKIPAVRTYARDLENNRKAKGLPAEKAILVEDEKKPIPKINPPVKKIEKIIADAPKSSERKIPQTASLPPLNTIQNKQKHSTKIIAVNSKNSTFIVDGNEAAPATIITDTKSDRFKLIPASIASLKEWFRAKKEALFAKKVPKYTVPESTRRKGVIQKATSMTGKLTTSDFSTIHERIKQRKEEEERPEPSTTWTANTEPGFLLLESPEVPVISNVKLVPRKSFRTPAAEIPTTPIVTTPVISVPEEITVPTTVVIEVPAQEPTESIAEEVETAAPEENNFYNEPTEDTVVEPSRLSFLTTNTNTLALVISGLVVTFIIVVIYAYFTFSPKEIYIVDAENSKLEMILDIPIKLAAGEKNNKASLLKVLKTVKENSNEPVQVAFVFSGTEDSLIPPHILFSIFGISLDKGLSRSISNLRIGYSSSQTPFLIMKVSDSTIAQGGLLEWESSMQKNLTDIFGINSESLLETKFIDSSLEGTDVRILKDTANNDLLIYGIKNGTIIITEDSQNFGELSNLIK